MLSVFGESYEKKDRLRTHDFSRFKVQESQQILKIAEMD